MQKHVLIFFEGVPGVGKSTLAAQLAVELDISIYPRNMTPGTKHAYFNENKEILSHLECDTIFDRFFWSDVVFSFIYQKEDFQHILEQFQEIHRQLTMSYHYLLVYVKNDTRKQQHSSFTETQLDEMEAVYDSLLAYEADTTLCIIDYPKMTIKDAISKIKRMYSDKSSRRF